LGIEFLELYEYCQTLKPRVSRAKLKKKIIEMNGVAPNVIKSSMDTSVSRGFFMSAQNPNNKYSLNGDTIILARELNYCWERFVYTKELMHLFDTEQERVNTDERLKGLLNSFEVQTIVNSQDPFKSELIAFWRALCCLCPEENRQEFLSLYSKGHIDTYGIALQLRIPEQYVSRLFDSNFSEIIEKIKR
jgi:hypothetical protein